jgi:cell division protein FtsI (penicillin-binding protein 3)
MNQSNSIVIRLAGIYILMLVLAVVVILKILAVQTIKTDRWEGIADNLTNYTVSLDPNRGNICADDGNVLATSVPGYYVRMDMAAPGVVKVYKAKSDSLALMLSSLFRDLPAQEYKRKLDKAFREKNRGFLLTPRKVDYNELQKIKKFPILRRGAFAGGRIIEQESKRMLPLGKLAWRTVGTLNKGAAGEKGGTAGNTGIEEAFEPWLKGKEGIGYRQNLSGRWVNRIEIEPRDGMDIMTTINIRYQDITESALERQLKQSNAEWGTAVLMETETGAIKAIANLGRVSPGVYDEIYNYAIGHAGCYEPGSTFKLISLMIALDQGLADTSTVFDTGNGSWKYHGRMIYDSDYGHGGQHGPLTLKQIFEKSSNVGVAKIITSFYEKKPAEFVDRIFETGIHKPLGIELTGEGIPKFKYPGDKDWWGTTLAWMSYGYESKMTPLQILAFYNAVANGGKMMKPYIVREIRDKGSVEKRIGPEVLNSSIASRSTIGKARKMLEGVCENGTGKSIQSKIVKLAGKTGTAQISSGQGGYGKGLYLASFVGYFPAEKPVFSMIVTVNKPQGAYYGGAVAGPVFREIAEKVYAVYQKIDPEKEDMSEVDQLPEIKNGITREVIRVMKDLDIDYEYESGKPSTYFTRVKKEGGSLRLAENPVDGECVPDVRGMGAKDAVFLLEKAGLQVRLSGIGKVKNQSLLPGYRFKKGQTILLILG